MARRARSRRATDIDSQPPDEHIRDPGKSSIDIQQHDKLDAAARSGIDQLLTHLGDRGGACAEVEPRWLDVLSKAMGHRPLVLTAVRDGQIVGYLPLAMLRGFLFGRFLVSLPYVNRGGVVSEDQDAAAKLIDSACALAKRYQVKYLELRHGSPHEHALFNAQRSDKVRMVLDTPEDEEALWKSIGAKVRNQIRKGEKSELQIQWGGRDLLAGFYDVFAVNMRDLGTPVYSSRLFQTILAAFESRAEVAVVTLKGQPIAGALLMHDDHRGETMVPSASCLRQFNSTNANMWMYHHLLLRAMQRGSRRFDFGRSSVDSGTYRFKKQWGAQPQPTVWQYHLIHGDSESMRPDNPQNARRVEQWKRLPVWLTRAVGPRIVRGIP